MDKEPLYSNFYTNNVSTFFYSPYNKILLVSFLGTAFAITGSYYFWKFFFQNKQSQIEVLKKNDRLKKSKSEKKNDRLKKSNFSIVTTYYKKASCTPLLLHSQVEDRKISYPDLCKLFKKPNNQSQLSHDILLLIKEKAGIENYEYKETSIGLIGSITQDSYVEYNVPSNTNPYPGREIIRPTKQIIINSNLNNFNRGNNGGPDILVSEDKAPKNIDPCSFDTYLYSDRDDSKFYFYDNYSNMQTAYQMIYNKGYSYWKSTEIGIKQYDGINQLGNAIFILDPKRSEMKRICILNIDHQKLKEKTPVFTFPMYVQAVGLHYRSNRFCLCGSLGSKNSIFVYDFANNVQSKSTNIINLDSYWSTSSLYSFSQCIFLTAHTLLGVTYKGYLYTLALNDNKSITIHRQFLKDTDKKDLLIKRLAVDFMNPRKAVFIDKNNALYLMDLKSKQNCFVKLTENMPDRPIKCMWFQDNKIIMVNNNPDPNFDAIMIKEIDYIPPY